MRPHWFIEFMRDEAGFLEGEAAAFTEQQAAAVADGNLVAAAYAEGAADAVAAIGLAFRAAYENVEFDCTPADLHDNYREATA